VQLNLARNENEESEAQKTLSHCSGIFSFKCCFEKEYIY